MKKHMLRVAVCILAGIVPLLSFSADTAESPAEKQVVIKITAPENTTVAIDNTNVSGDSVQLATTDSGVVQDSTVSPVKTDKSVTETVSTMKKKVFRQWDTVSAWKGFNLWRLICLFVGLTISIIIGRVMRWLIENYAGKFARKTHTDIDDLICEALGRPVGLLIFFAGAFLSTLPMLLVASEEIFAISEKVFLAAGAGSIAWGVYRLVTVINRVLTKLAESTENNLDDLIVAIIRKAMKVTIVVISALFIGQNILGINITTLLAGAGVMGLAVAFAAQDTIASFFGSIMIILDKPFTVGEMVEIAGYKGSVEHVGFRSVRLRTLDGHLITMPNKNVANAQIENIAARPFIKVGIDLGLTYDTDHTKMKRAIEVLHEILDNHEGCDEERPPRIIFSAFNDWSLNISITCWYHPADYGMYIAWIGRTNMTILERFNQENLDFAFPTNTTYLAYDEKRQVEFKIDSDHK